VTNIIAIDRPAAFDVDAFMKCRHADNHARDQRSRLNPICNINLSVAPHISFSFLSSRISSRLYSPSFSSPLIQHFSIEKYRGLVKFLSPITFFYRLIIWTQMNINYTFLSFN